MAGVIVGLTFQVILVLGLRLPEIADGFNLGHYFARPEAGGIDVRNRVFADTFLFVVGVVNGRPIRGAAVVALLVRCAWVMDLEEKLQLRAKARFGRVENNLDGLSVIAVIAVGSVRHFSAGVAHPR